MRCYLRFPKLLYLNDLTQQETEKILIQLDIHKKPAAGKHTSKIISKADIFQEIRVYGANTLLAQKICTLLSRKRAKGRDIYDIVYLFSFSKPNWNYLKEECKIKNPQELKNKLESFAKKKRP